MGGNGTSLCDDECWELWVGFWIEGLLLQVIAVAGIIGRCRCHFISQKKPGFRPAIVVALL